jgi:cutinase
MSAATRNRVTAVAMFGDTQNEQQNGQIANYPKEKVKIICNDGDEVCDGTLIVLPPHLEYNDRVPEATTFLVSKLKAA